MTKDELQTLKLVELKPLAKELNIKKYSSMKKDELIDAIYQAQSQAGEEEEEEDPKMDDRSYRADRDRPYYGRPNNDRNYSSRDNERNFHSRQNRDRNFHDRTDRNFRNNSRNDRNYRPDRNFRERNDNNGYRNGYRNDNERGFRDRYDNDRYRDDRNFRDRNGRDRGFREHYRDQQYDEEEERYNRLPDGVTNSLDVTGILEIRPEGYGLLENEEMEPPYDLVYVSSSQIQKFRLNTGDTIGGKVRAPKPGEKYAAMFFLEEVNGTETSEIIQKMDDMMKEEPDESDTRFQESHTGILDVNPDGYGFLRVKNYMPGEGDIYVASNQIRRYGLRTGDKVTGKIRKSSDSDRNDALLYIESVNGQLPELIAHRPRFDKLVPIFPEERLTLETDPEIFSTRMIDLFAPLGKGQRGMIVAPPKAGKTTLLKEIAAGIRANHPEVELIILLVDERPEEVTDMQRFIDADIVYSTFDQPPQNHLGVAEMVLERSKRLVEQGKDVVVLVDSLTRLTRANNLCVEPSGRTLSGGMDPESLYFPKKLFGSARNIENGASLTIIATALIDTGSRMDDIVFEEFKGTGNMEINLERELAQRRVFPAINLQKSGTRREDLLLTDKEQKGAFSVRKLYDSSPMQMTDKVITAFEKTKGNSDFLKRLEGGSIGG